MTVRLSCDDCLGGIDCFRLEGRAKRSLGLTAVWLRSWMLCGVSKLSVADVSGQRLGPIFKDPDVFLLEQSDPYRWERCAVPKRW
jgi:hypothetical protein